MQNNIIFKKIDSDNNLMYEDLYTRLKDNINNVKNNIPDSSQKLEETLEIIQDKLLDRKNKISIYAQSRPGCYSFFSYMSFVDNLCNYAEKIKVLLDNESNSIQHKIKDFDSNISFINKIQKDITSYELYCNIPFNLT